MSKPFSELREKMTPEQRKRSKTKTEVLKNELALKELSQAMELCGAPSSARELFCFYFVGT